MSEKKKKKSLPLLPRNPRLEAESLPCLEGYYIVQYGRWLKNPVTKWGHLRETLNDTRYLGGNIGMILGPIYEGGHGWFEIDIDDPEGLDPVLDKVIATGLLDISHYGIMKSGGNHDGWKIQVWLHQKVWDLHWPGKAKLAGIEVELLGRRGSARQTVMPPSRYINYYRWKRPIPPLETVTDWVAMTPSEQVDQQVQAMESLLSQFDDAEAASRAYHYDGDPSDLPTEIEGDFRLLLEALAREGVKFGPRGSERPEDGAIFTRDNDGKQRVTSVSLTLCPCPECKGHSRGAAYSPDDTRTAWITIGRRLKCFHAHSCAIGRRVHGMPESMWLPLYFPNLAEKFPGEQEEPGTGLSLEEAAEETRKLMDAAIEKTTADPNCIAIIDSPPGTGKSGHWVDLGIHRAAAGETPGLFGPRLESLDDIAARSLPFISNLRPFIMEGEEPAALAKDGPRVVPVQGAAKSCKLLDEAGHEAMSRYSTTSISSLCRTCEYASGCAYHKQWEWAQMEGSFNIGPHQLIRKTIESTPHTGPAWVDELPAPVEFTDVTLHEVVGPLLLHHEAGVLESENFKEYLAARASASGILSRALGELQQRKPKEYRIFVFGKGLKEILKKKKVLDGVDIPEALSYDPEEGKLPHFDPECPVTNQAQVSRNFDLLRQPVLNLLNDEENLADGMVAGYLDPDGGSGFIVMSRTQLLPDDRGVVITSAGSRYLHKYLEAVFHDREISVDTVRVQPSEWVESIGIDIHVLFKKYLVDLEGRAKTVTHVLRRLLPRIVMWGAKHNRKELKLGIACAKELKGDLVEALQEDTSARVEGIQAAFELYRLCGIVVTEKTIGHYGALDGSNDFRDVDVWLRLGDHRPNLGLMEFQAYGLACENNNIPGDKIETAFTDLWKEQNGGRPRPLNRGVDTPLLEIRCGYEPKDCEDMIEVRGKPPGTDYLLYQLLARTFFRFVGMCSVPYMREALLEIEQQELEEVDAGQGSPAYSQNTFPAFLGGALRALLLSLKTKRGTSVLEWFNDRSAGKRLKEMAEYYEAVKQTRKTLAENANQDVYIIPGFHERDITTSND